MRTLEMSLHWMKQGTELFTRALAAEDDDRLAEPTTLEGWTGKHLVAHVALNAAALGNLVHWAATGQETPMYPSPEQRAADIEAGAAREASELREWYAESAARLDSLLAQLSEEQWQATVRTAVGRPVQATEIPWMRSREVMVHAVDLGEEVYFSDLPVSFLGSLVDDILAKRAKDGTPTLELLSRNTGESWRLEGEGGGEGEALRIMAPIADLAAWLTGREGARVKVIGAGELPVLPAWL